MLKEICAIRAEHAEVPEFMPNDLSRSAESLAEHRKSARRKAAKEAQKNPSEGELVLFEPASLAELALTQGEAIRFPFQGLDI